MLTSERARELAILAASGDRLARNALAISLRPLAVSLARRHRSTLCSIEDLVNEGMIGVLEGIDSYDARDGVEPKDHACNNARRRIRRALRAAKRARAATFESEIGEPESRFLSGVPDRRFPAPPEAAIRSEETARVQAAMAQLGPLERYVIRCRFDYPLDSFTPAELRRATIQRSRRRNAYANS
jgi:RNA polymerase sigma factor (sigma-70 family)